MSSSDASSAASLFDPTRLRTARQAAMMRKKDLAEKIGVSAAAVSQYENGTTSPSARVVAALALALGQRVSFFAADRPLGEATATLAHFRSLRSTTKQEPRSGFRTCPADLGTDPSHAAVRAAAPLDLPAELAPGPGRTAGCCGTSREGGPSDYGNRGGTRSERRSPPRVQRRSVHAPPRHDRHVECSRSHANSPNGPSLYCRPSDSTGRVPDGSMRHTNLPICFFTTTAEPGTHAVERQANIFASSFFAPTSQIVDDLPTRGDWKQLLELKEVWASLSRRCCSGRGRSESCPTTPTGGRSPNSTRAGGESRSLAMKAERSSQSCSTGRST